jgi:hypothetical protein
MALLYGPTSQPGASGSSIIELAPGQTWTIAPAGPYHIWPSKYHMVQMLDPVMQVWVSYGGYAPYQHPIFVNSDGQNYRLINPTGLPVGALINNAGSGYTSTPTVTVSGTGGSLWRAIVGGAVSTSVTVTAAGTNYTYAPQVIFSPPSNGGIPASGYCTLSGSTIGSVTVTSQGAGYIYAPTITFLNDSRELANTSLSTGYGAAATATLTGANTVTGILCTDPGGVAGGLTALPSLTIAGGGGSAATAIVIMCWTITGYTVTTAGNLGSGSGSAALVTALDNFPTSAPAYTNGRTQAGWVSTRPAIIRAPITAQQISTPPVIYDGGIYTSSPTVIVQPTATVVTTAPVLALTLGGSTGVSLVYSIG